VILQTPTLMANPNLGFNLNRLGGLAAGSFFTPEAD
jgi:hypothetical protein